MNTYFVIHSVVDNYSLRMRYELPIFDLPQTNEYLARWVIVAKPIIIDSNMLLVRHLCDTYGKDRVVIFDRSNNGHGDYPCRVFAQNCKHDWPDSITGWLQPVAKKLWLEGRRHEVAPYQRKSKNHAITFCGDVKSHPCRPIGVNILRDMDDSFVKVWPDGFLGQEMKGEPLDPDYAESFNTRLMWCPPSRKELTWRLSEAFNAGVPIITTDFTKHVRLPQELAELVGYVSLHSPDMIGFEAEVNVALADSTLNEMMAVKAQEMFRDYSSSEGFWKFVDSQLNQHT